MSDERHRKWASDFFEELERANEVSRTNSSYDISRNQEIALLAAKLKALEEGQFDPTTDLPTGEELNVLLNEYDDARTEGINDEIATPPEDDLHIHDRCVSGVSVDWERARKLYNKMKSTPEGLKEAVDKVLDANIDKLRDKQIQSKWRNATHISKLIIAAVQPLFNKLKKQLKLKTDILDESNQAHERIVVQLQADNDALKKLLRELWEYAVMAGVDNNQDGIAERVKEALDE